MDTSDLSEGRRVKQDSFQPDVTQRVDITHTVKSVRTAAMSRMGLRGSPLLYEFILKR
jgi:hypothetical protein